MLSMKEKIVCITGAGSGIGQACAKHFAAAGAPLLLLDIKEECLAETKAMIAEKYDVSIYTKVMDISDKEQVEMIISGLPEEWKSVDVLVNNAGVALSRMPVQEGSADDWDTMIDINVKGVLYITRLLLPQMIDRNTGSIINIGSIAGREAYLNSTVYCATKAAVRMISSGLRVDLVDTDIRVTTIEPGKVKTNLSLHRYGGDEEKLASAYACVPCLDPDDIADAVVFVATRPQRVQIQELLITPVGEATATIMREESI